MTAPSYTTSRDTTRCYLRDSFSDASFAVPLWLSASGEPRLPTWVLEAWQRLKAPLLESPDDNWRVWIDWYEARLRGDPPDWERERAHVLDQEAFWKQGPAAANAEIARRLAEIDARRLRELFARAGWAEDPDSLLARLARGETPSLDSPRAEAALAALRQAAAAFRATLATANEAAPGADADPVTGDEALPGIGHNRPPEEARLTPPEIETAEDAVETIETELARPDPRPEDIARQTLRLALVYDGLARRAGIFADEFAKSAGGAAGKAAVIGLAGLAAELGGLPVLDGLGAVIDSALALLGVGPAPPPPALPPTLAI